MLEKLLPPLFGLFLGSATPLENTDDIGMMPAGLPPETTPCALSEEERTLLDLIKQSDRQERSRLRCNGKLQEFARMRAKDMAERGYFAHVTPDRVGPNELLRDSGYPLPSLYGDALSNSVEAIVGGYADPDTVYAELLASGSHRKHILGEIGFYRSQDEIGLAYVHSPDSEFEDYWVIVIARQERADEPRYLCSPEPAICFKMKKTVRK